MESQQIDVNSKMESQQIDVNSEMEVESEDSPLAAPEINSVENSSECSTSSTVTSELPPNLLRAHMLDHLANSQTAHFISQQIGDPELSFLKKKEIAEALLSRSPALFLGRFGRHLEEQHLKYFEGDSELLKAEAYEISFHLKELRRFHSKTLHMVDVKNRRYDALKKMIAQGHSYFSEDEMRQRNPYLYEQLVGIFLSEEERRERETPDLDNITFVNLLLTKIAKDETKKLRKEQEIVENGMQNDSSSGEEMQDDEESQIQGGGTWGETSEDISKLMAKKKRRKQKASERKHHPELDPEDVPDDEKCLMMEEFLSTMYNSFIDGNDKEFDYSEVDCNPDYDCIDIREKDEQEKYFDADNVEDDVTDVRAEDVEDDVTNVRAEDVEEMPLPPSLTTKTQDEEEDALDAFMKTVQPPSTTSDLTDSFQKLCQQSKVQTAEKSRVVKRPAIKFNIRKEL